MKGAGLDMMIIERIAQDPLILVVDDDDVIRFRLAEGPGAAKSAGADGDPLSNWHNPD